MKFICPECGCEKLEMVTTNAVVTWALSFNSYPDIEYDNPVVNECVTDHFQCYRCGSVLPVRGDEEELLDYLEQQEYNEDEQ